MYTKTYKITLKSIGSIQFGDYRYISEGDSIIIGRATQQSKSDFPVFNSFVSRKHCKLIMEGNEISIEDLGSKHGTAVNGQKIPPYKKVRILQGDIITLVNGIITFHIAKDDQLTLDYTFTNIRTKDRVTLSDNMQAIYIDKEEIKMPSKEYLCFKLLFRNMGELTNKEMISKYVWKERLGNPDILVTDEEITSLVYRVRKRVKKRFTIKSVTHKGYYMELND